MKPDVGINNVAAITAPSNLRAGNLRADNLRAGSLLADVLRTGESPIYPVAIYLFVSTSIYRDTLEIDISH